jgi:hypothetical protein
VGGSGEAIALVILEVMLVATTWFIVGMGCSVADPHGLPVRQPDVGIQVGPDRDVDLLRHGVRGSQRSAVRSGGVARSC